MRRLEASVLLSPTIKTTPHIWGAKIAKKKTKIANQKRGFSGSVDRTNNKKRKVLHSERKPLRQANDATRASGHGRLENADGSFQAIGGSTGGVVRTIPDDWTPPVLEDEGEESEPEDDAGERDATMHGVDWS